jgi:hypothetical protein
LPTISTRTLGPSSSLSLSRAAPKRTGLRLRVRDAPDEVVAKRLCLAALDGIFVSASFVLTPEVSRGLEATAKGGSCWGRTPRNFSGVRRRTPAAVYAGEDRTGRPRHPDHRPGGHWLRTPEPLSPVVAHRRWSGLTCLLGFLIRPLLLLTLRPFFLLGLLQPVSLGALEAVVGFAHEASPIRRSRWADNTAKEGLLSPSR